MGTREAYLAICSDDLPENRFEPFLLSFWEDGPKFSRLLASLEAVLPLREPSIPCALAMRGWRTQSARSRPCLAGKERISAMALDRANYWPPTVRRRKFEQALR